MSADDWFLPSQCQERLCKVCQSVDLAHDHCGECDSDQGDAGDLREALRQQRQLNRWQTEQLDQLHRDVRIGAWSLNCDDMMVELSDHVLAMCESSHGNYQLPADFAQFFPESLRVHNALIACAEHALAINLQVELTTAQGNLRWVRLTGQAAMVNGRIARVTGSLQDLSDQHAQTMAFMESEERFRQMVSCLSDGVIVFAGSPPQIDFVPPSVESLIKQNPASLRGMSLEAFRTLTHRDDFQRVTSCVSDAIHHALPKVRYTHRFLTGEGRYLWLEDHISFIYDSSGQLEKMYVLSRDISEQVTAAQALWDAKEQAQQVNRIKSDFLSSMSHELRTPMTGVLGMTELLLETELNAEQRDFAQTVSESGQVYSRYSTTS